MIIGFRHRGLQRLFEKGERRRIPPEYIDKVEDILARLDAATAPQDLNLPGYRLHQLSGDLTGFWSIAVSGNWRIIFRFDDGDVTNVDLVDYH
jgi:proteic killer suppression protein